MRGLIVLCFAAVALAAPQGYNYPSAPGNQYLAPGAGLGSGLNGHGHGSQGGYHHQQPIVTKRFFIHSAPEEDEVEVQHRDIHVGHPRKNFNVVFVKAPAASAQKTHIRVIPAVNEDKTVVYVLAKKSGENEVITHVEEPHTTTAKPEVFFIKYKTNEEAEHAQLKIQAEYDHLGGSSVVSNEGIAPVSSVIGSLGGHGYAAGAGQGNGYGATGGGYAANSAYLPPVKKH